MNIKLLKKSILPFVLSFLILVYPLEQAVYAGAFLDTIVTINTICLAQPETLPFVLLGEIVIATGLVVYTSKEQLIAMGKTIASAITKANHTIWEVVMLKSFSVILTPWLKTIIANNICNGGPSASVTVVNGDTSSVKFTYTNNADFVQPISTLNFSPFFNTIMTFPQKSTVTVYLNGFDWLSGYSNYCALASSAPYNLNLVNIVGASGSSGSPIVLTYNFSNSSVPSKNLDTSGNVILQSNTTFQLCSSSGSTIFNLAPHTTASITATFGSYSQAISLNGVVTSNVTADNVAGRLGTISDNDTIIFNPDAVTTQNHTSTGVYNPTIGGVISGDTTGDLKATATGTATGTSDLSIPSDGSLDFRPLMVAVDKFPFCIPWDLINLFRPFNQAPVPPKWHVEFPNLTINGWTVKGAGFDIDWSIFSSVALLCRYFSVLIFSYGLILKTRDLVKG
jgi:hypothetical protein